MNCLNLYYDERTSNEVWRIIADVKSLTDAEAIEKYSIDSKEDFLKMLFEDFQALVREEAEHSSYGTDDYKEVYAQLNNFL